MKTKILKIHNSLLGLKAARLVTLFVGVNFALSILFSQLSHLFEHKKMNAASNTFSSIFIEVFLVIFFAPLLETSIIQMAIIETAKNKLSLFYSCLLSAFIFALAHSYNLYYVLYAFFSGLILAYLYCIGGSIIRGFLLVLVTHVLYNSLVFFFLHI